MNNLALNDLQAQPEAIDFGGCAGAVEGLGPGKRAVLWVRGCPLGCRGCMTPELWESAASRARRSVEEVAFLLLPLLAEADGLTISGGEPMLQPFALRNLVQLLRSHLPELEVLVYSGFTLEELLQRGPEVVTFLSEIDMLIDGRFEVEQPNDLPWRGSDNQRLHLLSERGLKNGHTEVGRVELRPLQIQMLGNGQFRIVGIPRRGDLEKYRALMEERGVGVQKLRRSR